MEDYIFHEGPPPQGYESDFEPSLFNQHGHLYLQSPTNWKSFFVFHKKYKHILAAMHFHIEDNVARSPLKSPYGSVEASISLPHKALFSFLEFIESRLHAAGVAEIIIKNPPSIYQADISALFQVYLFNLGYNVSDAEVGTVISVSENSYESCTDSWERRRLRQAYDAGLRFKQLSPSQLTEVYLFILACRKQRGYSLSMALPDLKSAIERFPEHYLLFGAMQDDHIAAASIAIRVSENVLYNFYTAHPKDLNQLSPVVMLIEGLYKYCQTENIAMLDLGTSAVEGKPNFGLLDFKIRLGAVPTTKLTFSKKLG